MTTFLWVLAAIGAVVFAWILALSLSRAGGGQHAAAQSVAYESGKTRYQQDNEHPFNAAAFFAVVLIVGGVAGLAVALALT